MELNINQASQTEYSENRTLLGMLQDVIASLQFICIFVCCSPKQSNFGLYYSPVWVEYNWVGPIGAIKFTFFSDLVWFGALRGRGAKNQYMMSQKGVKSSKKSPKLFDS